MAKTTTLPAHTPGTWQVACDSYGKVQHSKMACVWRGSSNEQPLITIAQRIRNWHDARLIAAAPELLETLKQTYDAMKDGSITDTGSPIPYLVEKSIAKAECRG